MSNRGRRGSMRGGGFSGGRGRGRGNAVSEAIRAPSSTTSMTLHERWVRDSGSEVVEWKASCGFVIRDLDSVQTV